MRLLILFAAWARDDSENTHRWMNWYRDILDAQFPNDDKFFSVNYDASGVVENRFHDVPGLLGIERVSEKMHVNSDAASFQNCLMRCSSILKNYDYVFFMHTKGASYSFASFEAWRSSVAKTIFSRSQIAKILSDNSSFLVAERGHMIQAKNPILAFEQFAARAGCSGPTFHYAAGTTLFYAPAPTVSEMLERLPRAYQEENLLGLGESRFFFEAPIPSLLTMLGAHPFFAGGARLNDGLSPDVSYDCDPKHNSMIVLREYSRRCERGPAYTQSPVPYIFGIFEEMQKLNLQFAL